MSLLFSLADARDVVIVVWGIIGALFFLVGLFVAILLYFVVKGLIDSIRSMLDDSVKPALHSVRDAADTVRGTTEFMGRTTVTPVMKVYGMAAGVRKGVGVLTGLTGKNKAR